MSNGKLTKSSRDRMIAGVCGGLANHFDLDPTLVRAGFVLLSIFSVGILGVLFYIVLALIMPNT